MNYSWTYLGQFGLVLSPPVGARNLKPKFHVICHWVEMQEEECITDKKHITAVLVKGCLVSLLQYGTPIGSFKQQSFFFSLVAVWQRQRNLRREHVVRRWRLASLPCWVPANSLVGCLQNLGVPRPTEAFQGNGQPLLIASLCTDKLQHTQTPIKQWTNLMSKNLI